MRLSQIQEFVTAVQTGSLRAAARRLDVSQPAITKSLQQLEAELHVQLLQRTSRGVVPTRAGQAFLARARIVQAELRKAEDDLASLHGGGAGSVAFGTAPASCLLIVPEAVLAFRRRYPQVRVRITEGGNTALLPLVRDGTLDFSMGQKPTATLDPTLKFRPLLRLELVVAGRSGHPRAACKSLRELVDASWLIFNAPGSGGMLEQTFAAAGLPAPRDVVHCESYATALGLLSQTDTLALIVPALLTASCTQKPLVRIDVTETVTAPVIGIYTRAGTPFTPATAVMAQALTAAARKFARAR